MTQPSNYYFTLDHRTTWRHLHQMTQFCQSDVNAKRRAYAQAKSPRVVTNTMQTRLWPANIWLSKRLHDSTCIRWLKKHILPSKNKGPYDHETTASDRTWIRWLNDVDTSWPQKTGTFDYEHIIHDWTCVKGLDHAISDCTLEQRIRWFWKTSPWPSMYSMT